MQSSAYILIIIMSFPLCSTTQLPVFLTLSSYPVKPQKSSPYKAQHTHTHKPVRWWSLTQQLRPKVVRLDVLEEGGEDGQQRHRHVVDVLRHALHLRTRLRELAQLQHLLQLLQVLRGALEEGPHTRLHQLRARLHHRSDGGKKEVLVKKNKNIFLHLLLFLSWCFLKKM